MIAWKQIIKKGVNKYVVKDPSAKFPKFNNNLGYDFAFRLKQEEYVVWYGGASDDLLQFYRSIIPDQLKYVEEFRNSKDYFWSVVGSEDRVKCTHSSLPKAIVNTMTNILGKPTISAIKYVKSDDGKLREESDITISERIGAIIEDNDFYHLLKENQTPYMMVVGDGAYFINIDRELSDYPIVEFIDGRNIDYEVFANRIVSVTARKYYLHENKGYLLTDKRSTKWVKDELTNKRCRISTVEYKLYELVDAGNEETKREISLNSIPQTARLQSVEFKYIPDMLAVPCIYKFNKDTERGESMFASKLDLFDDLDQSKSMTSHVTRMSAPVDYLPEELLEHDKEGKPKKPSRFDRQYMVIKSDRNAVGQNVNEVKTTQPDLHFDKYNVNQLEIVMDILSGIMSPATLGIDLARKDNATAQREKEKVTLVTRDSLVDIQTPVLKKLFTLLLQIEDTMLNPQNKPGDYKITVNYPEYANPSFENKLAYLTPAYASGGMSEEKYVDELWEDALNEEEKKHEIETLRNKKVTYPPDSAIDNLMLE